MELQRKNQWHLISLLSSGIDSPVAAQISLNNKFIPLLVHMHNYPQKETNTLKVAIELAQKLKENNPKSNLSFVVIPHFIIQNKLTELLQGSEARNICIFCKILMLKKAARLSETLNIPFIVTGEILGEQASQTLSNLPVIRSMINKLIIRPLIGYNKKEVVSLSKKWGYYNISIKTVEPCIINPNYPKTRSDLNDIKRIYNNYSDIIDELIEQEVKYAQIYDFPLSKEKIVKDILNL